MCPRYSNGVILLLLLVDEFELDDDDVGSNNETIPGELRNFCSIDSSVVIAVLVMESLWRIHFMAIVLGSTILVLFDITVHFNTVENTPFPINPATRTRINDVVSTAVDDDVVVVVVAVVVTLVNGCTIKSIVSPITAL